MRSVGDTACLWKWLENVYSSCNKLCNNKSGMLQYKNAITLLSHVPQERNS